MTQAKKPEGATSSLILVTTAPGHGWMCTLHLDWVGNRMELPWDMVGGAHRQTNRLSTGHRILARTQTDQTRQIKI